MMEANLELTQFILPIGKIYNRLGSEIQNVLESGLREYIQSQTEKYYFTNTFIHRHEKVKFLDIYYPIQARYNKLVTNFSDLKSVFDENRNIILIGVAGSGKTTLIKYIFLRSIETEFRIPILIELRRLNDVGEDLNTIIHQTIVGSKVKPDNVTYQRALKAGQFIFLFDGFDEVSSHRKTEVIGQIEVFVDKYFKNIFAISTRPGSGIEGLNRFRNFEVQDLNNSDVEEFLRKIVRNQEHLEQISATINNDLTEGYQEYLRNPLLLSMFIIAFESHPEIPKRKSSFYWNVFDTLYSKHDGLTKFGFPREKQSGLERDEFLYVLSAFSYRSVVRGRYMFTESMLTGELEKIRDRFEKKFNIDKLIFDLRTSISILILDGFEYRFPHRSMQEYFTAYFISRLPSEKKEQAYKNLSINFENLSIETNLWGLCDELDGYNFNKYYIIPRLNQYKIYFEESLENGVDELVHTFLLLNGTIITDLFDLEEKKDIYGNELFPLDFLGYYINEYRSILSYCKISEFSLNIEMADGLIEKTIELSLVDKGLREGGHIQVASIPELRKVLVDLGLVDTINSTIEAINKHLDYLRSLSNRNDDRLDQLLDL